MLSAEKILPEQGVVEGYEVDPASFRASAGAPCA